MMPSYRESISSEDAWDVVNYVRKLQGNPVRETAVEETPATTDAPATEDTEQESAE